MCGLLCMKCLGITTAKDTSNLYTGLLVNNNGNRLWELSNQIVQAILHHYYQEWGSYTLAKRVTNFRHFSTLRLPLSVIGHYYHCAHILVSGRRRSEKMTDPGQQGQGTASAPNEPSNSAAHSTVANSQATTVCVRAVTWCQSPIPIVHWQTNHKLLYTPFGQSTSHYWVTVGNNLYWQVTTVQVVIAPFLWLFCMIWTTTYNLCNSIIRK